MSVKQQRFSSVTAFAVLLICVLGHVQAIRDTEVADLFGSLNNDKHVSAAVDDPPAAAPADAAPAAAGPAAAGTTYGETQKGAEQVQAKVTEVDKGAQEAEKKAKTVDADLHKYSDSVGKLKVEVDGLETEAKKFHKEDLNYLIGANSPEHSPLAQYAMKAKSAKGDSTGAAPAPEKKEETAAAAAPEPEKKEETAAAEAPAPEKKEEAATTTAAPEKKEEAATTTAAPEKKEEAATTTAAPEKKEEAATTTAAPEKKEEAATTTAAPAPPPKRSYAQAVKDR
eukprot:TRINITY_DN968_c0_g1_i2.p1 TRINITY_DN968_c0_g1~~TRINITY_DN968_c0_g1_i2.p1  ORF type:complete len:283 (-),score=128.99 TRINITY_DN968_c0_g1_i2:312-1160(-)